MDDFCTRMDSFPHTLSHWYRSNARDLPWRRTKDPYPVWVSEVILQQTRVNQGIGYYHRFLQVFPDLHSLASASDDELLKIWQGLGYYSRARNMLRTARYLVKECQGSFPDTLEGLLQLPGIGPYTAAAIASFCFGRPHAVVDGNVYRVLSRYHGEDTPIDSTQGKHLFAKLAQQSMGPDPAEHNQAIMEFGAILCTPKAPACPSCPFSEDCVAHRQGLVETLPVKARKTKVKPHHIVYLIKSDKEGLHVVKRPSKGIWAGLHDLPSIEAATLNELKKALPHHASKLSDQGAIIHLLSHRRLHIHFLSVDELPEPCSTHFLSWTQVAELGFPKVTQEFLYKLLPSHQVTLDS